MNSAPLKRTILKELAIFASTSLLLIGLITYLSMMQDDYISLAEKTGKVADQVRSEKTALENKFTDVKSKMSDYEESLIWAKSPGLYIDGQAMRDLFRIYQTNLFLKKLSVEMQPLNEIPGDPKYGLFETKTNGRITLESLTDKDVLDLIATMENELPGFLKINNLTLTKSRPVTKDVLNQIRRAGTYSLMTAEIKFEWYGLKSSDPTQTWSQYVPKEPEVQP